MCSQRLCYMLCRCGSPDSMVNYGVLTPQLICYLAHRSPSYLAYVLTPCINMSLCLARVTMCLLLSHCIFVDLQSSGNAWLFCSFVSHILILSPSPSRGNQSSRTMFRSMSALDLSLEMPGYYVFFSWNTQRSQEICFAKLKRVFAKKNLFSQSFLQEADTSTLRPIYTNSLRPHALVAEGRIH